MVAELQNATESARKQNNTRHNGVGARRAENNGGRSVISGTYNRAASVFLACDAAVGDDLMDPVLYTYDTRRAPITIPPIMPVLFKKGVPRKREGKINK